MPRSRPPDPRRPDRTPARVPGPVPEDNRPGHHPPVEQDKPTGPPPRPPGSIPRTTRFPFRVDWPLAAAGLPFGILPGKAEVVVGEEDLVVRFGPWSLRTHLTNVEEAAVTGPYSPLKVVGPPRVSLRDGGLTFATTAQAGVCIRLARPVSAVEPFGLLTHRGVTVTVAEPDHVVEEIEAAVRRVT